MPILWHLPLDRRHCIVLKVAAVDITFCIIILLRNNINSYRYRYHYHYYHYRYYYCYRMSIYYFFRGADYATINLHTMSVKKLIIFKLFFNENLNRNFTLKCHIIHPVKSCVLHIWQKGLTCVMPKGSSHLSCQKVFTLVIPKGIHTCHA